MIIWQEKGSGSDVSAIKKISRLYTQLDVLFAGIAQIFLRQSLKSEGVTLEARASNEDILSALNEVDKVLSKLKSVENNLQFDNISHEKIYRNELTFCKNALGVMKESLNTIWSKGEPGNKEVPFMGTTSYRFVYETLLRYMNITNALSKSINEKAKVFGQLNKDISPLPVLPFLVAPKWIKNIK
jgi:ribosome-associated translation inhibitor RaiA